MEDEEGSNETETTTKYDLFIRYQYNAITEVAGGIRNQINGF